MKQINLYHGIAMLLCFTLHSCGQKINQKSINMHAKFIKAEMNKLSVSCPVDNKGPYVDSLQNISISGLSGNSAQFQLNNKYVLNIDANAIDIIVNKITKDGYQFRYKLDTEVVDFETGKSAIDRDEGTIWMYCNDFKKWNTPKEKEPKFSPPVMVTVE